MEIYVNMIHPQACFHLWLELLSSSILGRSIFFLNLFVSFLVNEDNNRVHFTGFRRSLDGNMYIFTWSSGTQYTLCVIIRATVTSLLDFFIHIYSWESENRGGFRVWMWSSSVNRGGFRVLVWSSSISSWWFLSLLIIRFNPLAGDLYF